MDRTITETRDGSQRSAAEAPQKRRTRSASKAEVDGRRRDPPTATSALLALRARVGDTIRLTGLRRLRVFLLEPNETPYDLRFALFGIPIRVHPMFWLVSAVLGWSA